MVFNTVSIQLVQPCSHAFHTCGLVVIDVDPLELEVRVTMVCASGVNAVFIRDHLPELQHTKTSQLLYM